MPASAASLVSRYSFSEASGTSAADSIGGFTATLNGGSSFDGAGKVVLNGTGSYVSLPPAQLSGLTAVTIDTWFFHRSQQQRLFVLCGQRQRDGFGRQLFPLCSL